MDASADLPEETLKHSKVLSLAITEKNQLSSAYLPFVKNGGLFIATDKEYHLGDEVFLVLRFFDEKDKYTLPCNVVWITPKGAQGGSPCGIGVQFLGDDATPVRNKIETYLIGHA